MSRLLELLRGLRRDPLHDALTALIGAYTLGIAMLLLAALGVAEEQMTYGALLAIGAGLTLTVPTTLAAVFDLWEKPKGTPARAAGTLHLVAMALATALFALTFALQLEGHRSDEVTTSTWIAAVGALAVLIAGGYIGRAPVLAIRVRGRASTQPPVREALTARPEWDAAEEPAAQGRDDAAPRLAAPPSRRSSAGPVR